MADASETSSMSSLGNSPPDTIRVAPRTYSSPRLPNGVIPDGRASASQHAAHPHTTNGHALTSNADHSDAKPKRQRKARESKEHKPAVDAAPKEKKTRKPRETKPKADVSNATAGPRKKVKLEEKQPDPTSVLSSSAAGASKASSYGPRQPTLTEMLSPQHAAAAAGTNTAASTAPSPQTTPVTTSVHMHRSSHQPLSASHSPQPAASLPASSSQLHRQHVPSNQTSPLRAPLADPAARGNQLLQPTSNPSTPRPFSSGQKYDPIRGMTVDAIPPRPLTTAPISTSTAVQPPSAPVNRASASSSIHSLIDPPMAQSAIPPLPASLPYQAPQQLRTDPSRPVAPRAHKTSGPQSALSDVMVTSDFSSPKPGPSEAAPDAMEIDTRPSPSIAHLHEPAKPLSKSPSAAATAPRAAVVPKASGSGLLSSSTLFGGIGAAATGTERKGVDIEIVIPLNPNGGNTINIAQEIVKKYGRDAINPRAVAHRERLLQVAAAARQIDGGSGGGGAVGSADDMSVDLMSEPDDSNIEMGGLDDEKSATGADEGANKAVKKRKKKAEDYDKDDDFIDDTELIWQEQAAVAKGGFFVYSGPLIPEGQSAQVESSQPTRGTRGRGRGRGRAAAAASTTHASLAADKGKDPNAPATTGRGRGYRGRGTNTLRKPRITKAERERLRLEQERERERELASAGAGGSNGLLGGPTGAAISLGPTLTGAGRVSTLSSASHHAAHAQHLDIDRGEQSSHWHQGPPSQQHQQQQQQHLSSGKGPGSAQAV